MIFLMNNLYNTQKMIIFALSNLIKQLWSIQKKKTI